MKKLLSMFMTILMIMSLMTGCSSKGIDSATTDGSTSMQKVIGGLGEVFQNETGINFAYNSTGSGSGIQAVAEGRCDIGLSSRELKEEEMNAGLVGTVLAYDGIALIVNLENTVSDLTMEQITKIYTGEIKNWSEVGVTFFPHNNDEDYAISYDTCLVKELLNTKGRRSKKRDQDYLEQVRIVVDEIAKTINGIVYWDKPLRDAKYN